MKAFFPLLSIYVKTTYNPQAFFELFRQGPKGIAKGLGICLLVLYATAAFGVVLLMSSFASYSGLAPLGLAPLVILNGVSSATAIVMVMGFITCLATYFMSEAESSLLAMPIPPRALFGAKFAMTYLSEALIAILMVASSCGVYAYFERPPFLFYPYLLLIALATPLLPLSFFYLILVPLMTRVRFLRRKDTIFILGGVIGIGLALGWQLFYQRMMLNMGNSEWLLANLADPDSVLKRFSRAFPPALFAANALSGSGTAGGLGWLAAFLGVQAASVSLILLALPGAYASSLVGFNESVLKRNASTSGYLEKTFRPQSPLLSHFRREVRQMNREPVFFLNGPFVVFLVPLLLGAIYGSMKKELLASLPAFSGDQARSFAALGAMGIVAMLGAMNGITSTSLSREGPQFAFLKSLPVRAGDYFGAKLAHGLVFCLVAVFTGPLLVAFLLPLELKDALGACLGGFGFACLFNVLGLLLDTANPRLSWPNPTVAIKQNPNYAVSSLGGMACVAGYCVLVWSLRGVPHIMAISGLACLALAAMAWAAFLPWARRRFLRIEG
jgi:ABC-2 type transport system permease protein